MSKDKPNPDFQVIQEVFHFRGYDLSDLLHRVAEFCKGRDFPDVNATLTKHGDGEYVFSITGDWLPGDFKDNLKRKI
jgi:hypothetical protein